MKDFDEITYSHSAQSRQKQAEIAGKNVIAQLGGCTAMLITLLIMRPVSFILYGIVAMWYWAWFAIPFADKIFNYTLDPISWGYGIALIMFTHFLCNREHQTVADKNADIDVGDTYVACILYSPILTCAYLAFGWLIKTICL